MYIAPAPYKCVTCGFEFNYSPHEKHPSPVTEKLTTCPRCWEDFLSAHIGLAFDTRNFTGKSQYDQAIEKQKKDLSW